MRTLRLTACCSLLALASFATTASADHGKLDDYQQAVVNKHYVMYPDDIPTGYAAAGTGSILIGYPGYYDYGYTYPYGYAYVQPAAATVHPYPGLPYANYTWDHATFHPYYHANYNHFGPGYLSPAVAPTFYGTATPATVVHPTGYQTPTTPYSHYYGTSYYSGYVTVP